LPVLNVDLPPLAAINDGKISAGVNVPHYNKGSEPE
jgi:hypothetical protein